MPLRPLAVPALLCFCLLALFSACSPKPPSLTGSRQATGVKVGEVTPNSAIVWMRVTRDGHRRSEGIVRRGWPQEMKTPLDPATFEGAAPGAAGRARVRYATSEDLSDAGATPWTTVAADGDFTVQFQLSSLSPDTRYYFSAETSSPDGEEIHQPLRGTFRTAPLPSECPDLTFTVITCQAYRSADHPDGFLIYDSMARLGPAFFVPTGDNVYYDNDDPRARNIAMARYHWQRMYSHPKLVAFHLKAPGYWEKDDHDLYYDDCYPGMKIGAMGEFTFEQGLKVWREQTPQPSLPYRTHRWGAGLQIWLTEGREFRSPNSMPDGPGKSIWGAEQKRWLKETLLASDATWRILINPTPIVGPDRDSKADNHANAAYAHEGSEFRRWAAENLGGNFFIVNGDRHWQYHSVDPETGLHEFGCGPASDVHAGGTPGENKAYHQFHRLAGGFLSVNTRRANREDLITFRHHDVNGAVVYEHTRSRPVR